ncbi:hypothetical protein CDL15_Pgr010514 [Punica granatum]|uniref:VQ domain-containing protein n=1 Tax=Punica granatum TaxID=22663 RepID=A0A218XVZ5_PUNGR|nr:hypothetical protein CDL15_Pgr010514 [Punica granatum]
MSPSHLHEDPQRDRVKGSSHPPLKISKDLHCPMKRSSPSSSSSSSSSQQSSMSSTSSSSGSALINGSRSGGGPSRGPGAHQRQPVIIYTHSPKVIHTQPQDFMALVQKLTGLCHPEDSDGQPPPHPQSNKEPSSDNPDNINKNNFSLFGGISNADETEASSVITEENNSINIAESQVINSTFLPPPIYEGHPNLYMTSFPVFNPNSSPDFLRPNQSNFYSSYGDRLYFGPNIRSTFTSTPTLEMIMNELREC